VNAIFERIERPHPQDLVVGAVGVVHLEVQAVLGQQGEEQLAAVEADAAEHPPRPHRGDPLQLLQHEFAVLGADRHDRFSSSPVHLMTGSGRASAGRR
jgi:hypothetical protein